MFAEKTTVTLTERDERCARANRLLEVIATCGRRFFFHEGRIARLELERGRVFFVDHYTGRRVYTHDGRRRWRGFTGGGTLRQLVIELRNFVCRGEAVHASAFGPWSATLCDGDLWGYGEDMERVRAAARELRIVPESSG